MDTSWSKMTARALAIMPAYWPEEGGKGKGQKGRPTQLTPSPLHSFSGSPTELSHLDQPNGKRMSSFILGCNFSS